MTLRERIADWLTRGEYSAHIEVNDTLMCGMAEYGNVLRAISAEAKRGKNPNATVRRMGKMADEAVG